MRSERVDALRASIYPLTATFTPQPPLTRPLEATTPPDLALEGPRCPRQVDLGNWDHWGRHSGRSRQILRTSLDHIWQARLLWVVST